MHIDHTVVSGWIYVTEKSKLQSSCAFPFSLTLLPYKNTSETRCVWIFPHHAILWDTSWWFYNVIQFKHHLPGDGISSHRLQAQSRRAAPYHFRSWLQTQVVICASKWFAIKNSSHESLFRFKSFVRVTHRTQESSLRTVFQFIMKGYGTETSRWERYVRHEALLPIPSCIHQPGSSPNPILLGFLWMLYHIAMIDHFLLPSFTLSEEWGPDLKIPRF